MPIDAQQDERGLGPVTLDYIASSAEKMDILPVGVKKSNRPNDRSSNSPAFGQMSSVGLLVRIDDQDTSAR